MVKPLGLPESSPLKPPVDLRRAMARPTLEFFQLPFQRQFAVHFKEQMNVAGHNHVGKHLPDTPITSLLNRLDNHFCELRPLEVINGSQSVEPFLHLGENLSAQFQSVILHFRELRVGGPELLAELPNPLLSCCWDRSVQMNSCEIAPFFNLPMRQVSSPEVNCPGLPGRHDRKSSGGLLGFVVRWVAPAGCDVARLR